MRKDSRSDLSIFSMQQSQRQNSSSSMPVAPSNGPRLSTGSHSSATVPSTNVLLNGLLPSHRSSQTLLTVPVSFTSNPSRPSRKGSEQLNRTEKLQHASIVVCLSLLLALLLIITVQSSGELVRERSSPSNSTLTRRISSSSSSEDERPLRSFFAAVWLFNALLFVDCLFIHIVSVRRRSRRTRTVPAFLR